MKDTTTIDNIFEEQLLDFRKTRFSQKYDDNEKEQMTSLARAAGWNHEEVFEKASEVYVRPGIDLTDLDDLILVFVGGSAFDVSEQKEDELLKGKIRKTLEFGHYAGHLYNEGYNLAIISGGTPINSLPFIFQYGAKQISPQIPTIGVRGEKTIALNNSMKKKEYRDTLDVVLHYNLTSLPLIGHEGDFYMPLLYRNPINVSLADNDGKGGIAISLMGGSGTLTEMALAYHQRLICAFWNELEGTSKNVKDVCDSIFEAGQKPDRMTYFQDGDSQRLLHRAIAEYEAKQMNGTPLARFSVYNNIGDEMTVNIRDAGRHVTRRNDYLDLLGTVVICGITGDELAKKVRPQLDQLDFKRRDARTEWNEEGIVYSNPDNHNLDQTIQILNLLIRENPILYRERNLNLFSDHIANGRNNHAYKNKRQLL